MAEKGTSMTPSRQERQGATRTTGGGAFSMFQRFADEVDRMFEEFGFGRRRHPMFQWGTRGETGWWAPDVDVIQRQDQLVIKADLPGLRKEDISIEITDDALTLHGERRQEHEEEREGVYRSERSYGSFRRVIPLPDGAITDQAKASFRDGVLEITMPAPPATTRSRRLEIAEGAGQNR